jgi:hypothetical protein
MKIRKFKNQSKYSLGRKIKKFPWNFSKMIKFKRRIWSRIKFSKHFLSKISLRAMNTRLFTTYKNKTKKLFRRYFAPNLTDRQCRKLFRSNPRYKATFQKILKSEHRFDTLVFRLYMLPNISIARELIKKNYFLLNGKSLNLSKIILNVGDIVEATNKIAWQFLYNNMMNVMASLKKYFSRIFFKFSFPFIIKRRRIKLREFGKFKDKVLNRITTRISERISRRVLYFRYKKLKAGSTSKTKPAKKYYFKLPKEAVKTKRIKNYILKKIKLNLNFSGNSKLLNIKDFPKGPKVRFRNQRRQLELISQLPKIFRRKTKNNISFGKKNSNKALPKKYPFYKSLNTKKRVNKLVNFLINKSRKRQQNLYKSWLSKINDKSKKNFRFQKNKILKKKKHLTRLRVGAIRQIKSLFFILKKKKNRKTRKIATFKLQKLYNFFTKNLKKLSLNSLQTLARSKKKTIKKPLFSSALKKDFKNSLFSLGKKKTQAPQKIRFLNLFLNTRSKHIKLSKKFKSNKVLFKIKARLTRHRLYRKAKWSRFVLKRPKNYWQFNRITKKHISLFRYLKKFNNNYKQFRTFQNLNQISWTLNKFSFWQKTTFLFEKKRKKLLLFPTSRSGSTNLHFVCIKRKTKTLSFLKKLKTRKFLKKYKPIKKIIKIKRKYLLLKGFYRKYKNFKVEINFAENNNVYSPIQIKYKKINLLFKHRPIAYYFAEFNYKSLDFTLVNDVDFLFFPHRTAFDFKILSFL